MPTYPLATLGPTIDESGISAPPYDQIYQSLIASYKEIYGADCYLAEDSQDGQWIAVLAKAIDDSNKGTIKTFHNYSPSYAVGNALSAAVKINGIERLSSSNSTVNVTVVGQVGKIIVNGVAADTSGNKWNLPASVTIPPEGQIVVTAIAQQPGAIPAAAGAVNSIATPQQGWQSVTNASAAVAGQPVETDPRLRLRREDSVAQSSLTILEGIEGAIRNLTGVTAVRGYENDSGSTDENGIPAGAIAMVVDGGIASEIATTINLKKTLGAPTYGSTTITVYDSKGEPNDINYSVPAPQRIKVEITLHGLVGYNTNIGAAQKQAVADYINGLTIGNKIMLPRLQVPAQLYGAPDSLTFEIVTIKGSIYPAAVGTSDITIGYNQIATCQVADIVIVTA